MNNDIRKIRYQNRIELLNSRTGKENSKIVKKLQRRLRALNAQEI
jgi:hypothetical protein